MHTSLLCSVAVNININHTRSKQRRKRQNEPWGFHLFKEVTQQKYQYGKVQIDNYIISTYLNLCQFFNFVDFIMVMLSTMKTPIIYHE